MSVQVENLEKNMAKLTIEVSAEEFEKAVQNAYLRSRGKITIPGFRKGKAPRVMIEKMYGAGIFFEDAANALIQAEYPKAADESGLEIVSQPEIDVVQIEKGKAFIFTAEVAVKPEVTLGEYKGLEVEVTPADVTEEEVAAELKREQENNSRTIDVDDRAVADGDMVTLDFEGFVDGVAFEGGKGTDYPLTIGSNSFIPGFEEQLVGAEIGVEKEVNVTFPENYHANDLAGKAAVFKCTVKAIKVKELPELDDEFAKDVSEFDTLDAYKADIEKKLKERKEAVAKREREDKAVDAVIENAQMDIPEAMIQNQIQQLMQDFIRRMQAQGLSIDQYYQFTGLDNAKIQEQMRPQALKRIQSRLVLEKIAETENIQISDEKFEEELKAMADMYKMEVEKLKEVMGDYEKEQIKKGKPQSQKHAAERDITVGELVKMSEELQLEPVSEPEPVKELPKKVEEKEKRTGFSGIRGYMRKPKFRTADTKKESEKKEPETPVLGEINPYTGKEYQTNSVRMHPKRIGYVQVYDQEQHKWTDMTEWAFLGYQERKKALLGKDYDPPIYLD